MNPRNLARLGEEKARRYLQSKGYKVLEKNFKTRFGEIDIVALENNCLVAVEIKTRYSLKFGKPEEAVTPQKIYTISRTAQYYQLIHPHLPNSLRVDVVAVEISKSGEVKRLELIKNVTS